MPKENEHDERLDSTMSLGDHLEELRARLILALLGLGVALVVCLFFGKPLIGFLEKPYIKAMTQKARKVEVPIPEDANSPSAFVYGEHIIFVLEMPGGEKNVPSSVKVQVSQGDANSQPQTRQLVTAKIDDPPDVPALQTLAPADGFVAYMKIAFIAAIVIAAPWVFYHLWMFVAAGLYANERRYVKLAVPFSAGLFMAGSVFFLLVVAPLSMKFLVKFNEAVLGVQSQFTFDKYISFITLLMLVFGLAFQTPIAIYLLNRTGLVSTDALRRSRKYVFLGVFILAAAATPPDVISQVTLAVPLYMLFELGIILSDVSRRRREALVRSE